MSTSPCECRFQRPICCICASLLDWNYINRTQTPSGTWSSNNSLAWGWCSWHKRRSLQRSGSPHWCGSQHYLGYPPFSFHTEWKREEEERERQNERVREAAAVAAAREQEELAAAAAVAAEREQEEEEAASAES